jgi:hypothetical protein
MELSSKTFQFPRVAVATLGWRSATVKIGVRHDTRAR